MHNLFSNINAKRIGLFVVLFLQIITLVLVYRGEIFDIHYIGFDNNKPYFDDEKYNEYQKQVIGAFENFNSYYLIDIVDENQCVSLMYGHINNLKKLAVHGVVVDYPEDFYWISFVNGEKVGICRNCPFSVARKFCENTAEVSPSVNEIEN